MKSRHPDYSMVGVRSLDSDVVSPHLRTDASAALDTSDFDASPRYTVE
jgi:hypothetical protein